MCKLRYWILKLPNVVTWLINVFIVAIVYKLFVWSSFSCSFFVSSLVQNEYTTTFYNYYYKLVVQGKVTTMVDMPMWPHSWPLFYHYYSNHSTMFMAINNSEICGKYYRTHSFFKELKVLPIPDVNIMSVF